MNAAFDNVCFKGSVVSQSARFVYLCLCKHADNTNQTCFPSLNRIAEIVGRSLSTIKRAIRELCKYGAIERTPRFRKDGGQTSNLYKVKQCNLDNLIDEKQEIDQEKCSVEENQNGDIYLSVPEDIPSAPACTTEPEEIIVKDIELPSFENDFINNIYVDSKDSADSSAIGASSKINPVKKLVDKLSVLGYLNEFKLKIKGLSSGLHTLKAIKFCKNEQGGGHGRPSRNLYN